MASGSFAVATDNTYIIGSVAWSSVENIDGNSSEVTATFRMSRTNNYTTSGQGNFTLTINGVQNVNSGSFSVSLNSNTLIITNTVKVPHDSDGNKQIVISVNGTHARFNIVTKSETVSLGNIARGSRPIIYTSETDLGNNITIDIAKADPSFRHILKYKYADSPVETIATGVDSQHNWIIPLNLATNIPNSTEAILTIYCDTYNGSKYISTRTVDLIAKLPTSIVPTTAKITTTEMNPKLITMKAVDFVSQVSDIKVEVVNAFVSLPYGANLKSFRIELGDEIKDSGVATFIKPKISGMTNIRVHITDTRGRTSFKDYSIYLISYEPPSFSNFQSQRVDAYGNPSQDGERVIFKFAGKTSKISDIAGTNVNTYNIVIYYKNREVSTFSLLYQYNNNTLIPFNMEKVFINFSQAIAFDFRIEVTDAFYTSKAFSVISTAKTILSLGKNGVGVNKIWEQGALDVKGDIFEDGQRLADKYVTKNTSTIFSGLRYDFIPYSEFKVQTPNITLNGLIDTNNHLNVGGNIKATGNIDTNGIINGKSGYLNVAKKTAMQWEGGIASGSNVVITHNLGYFPICQVYNGSGGSGVAFDVININQVRAKYWSATGGGWYGFIMLW